MIVRVRGRRVPIVLAAVLLVAAPIISALSSRPAYAAQITQRSLTLQTGTDGPDTDTLPDGGSQPSGHVNHLFTFTVPTVATNIGSIMFLYCTSASGSDGDTSESTCTAPAGLDVTSATLGAEGSNATGFSKDTTNSTTNKFILTKGTPAAPTAGSLSYRLDGVINPSATSETFFVRIKTYSTSAATGTPTDTGTVAASTAHNRYC